MRPLGLPGRDNLLSKSFPTVLRNRRALGRSLSRHELLLLLLRRGRTSSLLQRPLGRLRLGSHWPPTWTQRTRLLLLRTTRWTRLWLGAE